jgi:hypothetical protein
VCRSLVPVTAANEEDMGAQAIKLDAADRKEIWEMLDRLSPFQRVDFLQWCCRQVVGVHRVQVTSHSGTTNESLMDMYMLELQYKLDLAVAVAELVRRIRRV